MISDPRLQDVSVSDTRENGLKWVARLLEIAAFHLNALFTQNTENVRSAFFAALAPAEGMARRILALLALEAGLPAKSNTLRTPRNTMAQHSAPDQTTERPPLFKLTEPLPRLCDADETRAKTAIATAKPDMKSDPTLACLKRFEALTDVLENTDKHIARMARELACTRDKNEPVLLDTYTPPGLFDEGIDQEVRNEVYRCNAALVETLDTS